MDSIRELSHTADIGFEVEAPTLERLFELSAEGLVAALGLEARAGRDRAAQPETETIRLEKGDRERLLVAWLRELLWRCTSRHVVPEGTDVRMTDEATLEARVSWRPWPESGPVREIKGVTYHGLEVARRREGWHARVVFDV
ncbi:MAG: archease [Gemmatimonadota bacterium]|nr:archease [Gemmatimonadota bacterium]